MAGLLTNTHTHAVPIAKDCLTAKWHTASECQAYMTQEMRTYKEAEDAGKNVGFELVLSVDIAAASPVAGPWCAQQPAPVHHNNNSASMGYPTARICAGGVAQLAYHVWLVSAMCSASVKPCDTTDTPRPGVHLHGVRRPWHCTSSHRSLLAA